MELKFAVASLMILGCLTSPAFAQGETGDKPYGSGTWTFTTPSGAVVRMTLPAARIAEMVKGATPMTVGTMMMMHDGKMYVVQDQKLPDGKMMSDLAMGK